MYVIKKDTVRGGYFVQHSRTGKVCYTGTQEACQEWVMMKNGDW